jgi:hypothetical protein
MLNNQAYNSIKRKQKKHRRNKVTQIVGALCESRTRLVLVSDRMVADEDDTLHFEHECKGEVLNDYTMALAAGTMHEPEIISNSMQELSGNTKSQQLIEVLAKNYQLTRRKRIEAEILSRYGFFTFDEYHNKQRLLTDDTVKSILEELNEYELNLDLLIGGVDTQTSGAYLYTICDPGIAHSYSAVGFCCIGSGGRHADPVFAFYGYKPSMRLEEVLYIAYVAKRRAEMAGGVGRDTDAWIIKEDGCHKVNAHTLNELENTLQGANLSDLHVDVTIKYDDSKDDESNIT